MNESRTLKSKRYLTPTLLGLGLCGVMFVGIAQVPAAGARLRVNCGQSNPIIQPALQQSPLADERKRHQEEIRAGARKLLDLASQLKQAVDKTNENTLSMDVVRKADELEKMAKRLKEQLKNNPRQGPKS